MANYFVINNKFRPYSFDELVKPYQIYGQAYKEQEAALDAAREKEFSPDYLDPKADEAAYNMYNAATSGLKAASDELATKGLSPDLRGRIRSTVRDYTRTMGALTAAQDRLNTEMDRRAKNGPGYVYQQDTLRIGDFLNGKTPNQKGVKLADVTADVASEFAARAKGITKDTWDKVLGVKGYWDIKTEAGLKDAQLDTILALANPEEWNRYVASNPSITDDQKRELKGFVDSIGTEMDAVGFDKYNLDGKKDIWKAIVKGAHAGLGSTAHNYKEDKAYNPLGWASLNFQKSQAYKQDNPYGELPYTHSDENNPTQANRTGLKDGWTIKGGKLQYGLGESGNGTDYTIKTPNITVHTADGTRDYGSWKEAREANAGKNWYDGLLNKKVTSFDNLPAVAIEDITDPDIKRAALNRINVPNANVDDDNLAFLIAANLAQLNQLTVQIGGTPGTSDYIWAISDKNVQRLTEDGSPETPQQNDKSL